MSIIYGICRAYAESNCAEMILNKQRYLLRGYCFLSNKEVMEKLGSTDFFSLKKIESRLEINKKLLGLQYLTKICVQWQPHVNYQRYSHYGLHYWFMITLQLRGWSYNFWLSHTGITKYCRGTFGNLWTPIPKCGDLIINLFHVFLINQILRNNDFSEI